MRKKTAGLEEMFVISLYLLVRSLPEIVRILTQIVQEEEEEGEEESRQQSEEENNPLCVSVQAKFLTPLY
jgi:hypothetical protein